MTPEQERFEKVREALDELCAAVHADLLYGYLEELSERIEEEITRVLTP